MSEKRKPNLIILLRKPGKEKANKLESFDARLWDDSPRRWFRSKLYRLRVNGRWNDKIKDGNLKYMTKWQFRDLLFRSIDI